MDRAIDTGYAPGIWKSGNRIQRVVFFLAITLIPLSVTLVTACLIVHSFDVLLSCLLFTGPLYIALGVTLTKFVSGKEHRSLNNRTKTTGRVNPVRGPSRDPIHCNDEIDYKWHIIDEMMNGL